MTRSVSILAAVALAGTTQAQVLTWDFPLTGEQETPPIVTTATGQARVQFDTATNMLSWDITFSGGGLTGGARAAHFHEAPIGVPGPVRVDIGMMSGLASPMVGMTTITDTQRTALLAGNWYINIHSNTFPGGELRGQVIPAPAVLAVMGAGAMMLGRRRR